VIVVLMVATPFLLPRATAKLGATLNVPYFVAP
jgi:hypothetical protein